MADLVVENVTKQFPAGGQPLVVLRGISFELSAGENMTVVGPSGSGKSTLLHIIGALDQPTSGAVTLGDQEPFLLDEPQLADFRNRLIGFVFQDHYLLAQCSVLENVLLPTIATGAAGKKDVKRAQMLLDRVGLSDRLDHRPPQLSGGERQRVAIARALILGPVLVLADEPTGNLDHSTATAIADLLLELQKQEQNMLIVVTHSMKLARRMDRTAELNDGRLSNTN